MALKKCKECGNEISTSAPACPHCGKKGFGFSWGAIRDIIVVGLLVWVVFEQFRTEKPGPTDFSSLATSREAEKPPRNNPSSEGTSAIPEQERNFCEVIDTYRKLYFNEYHKKKYTDQQKNLENIFNERNSKLIQILGDGNIQGWKGIIRTITVEHGDGAWLEVNLPCNTRLDTQDDLVIKAGTPLYDSLMNLRERSLITFSGNFFISPQTSPSKPLNPTYYKESSFTLGGSIDSPEFLFGFKDVTR